MLNILPVPLVSPVLSMCSCTLSATQQTTADDADNKEDEGSAPCEHGCEDVVGRGQAQPGTVYTSTSQDFNNIPLLSPFVNTRSVL